jgi:hypothetical protein
MADAAISAMAPQGRSNIQPVRQASFVMGDDGSRMEGVLWKRGLNGMWHERYFVFNGQTLVYYKRKPGTDSGIA